MRRNSFVPALAVKLCLLMLMILLLLAACNGSSSPNSQPTSPSNGGYSHISSLDR
ncbi:MAG TPA: hypothetical protein VKR06_20880 [Ktedonosporobacter sp.]|nr:hypothetical protein [Ktedonosporobacter sp.]